MDTFVLTKEYLETVINNHSRSLVGMLAKRVEVLEKNNSLKPQLYKDLAKELVYENFRSFKSVIEAFSYGVKFINKDNK